jgi:hypothetical protein
MEHELTTSLDNQLKQDAPERTNGLLSFYTTRATLKTTRPTILLLLRVYLLPR